MQKAGLQKMHKGFPVFKERVPRMRGQHQDRARRHQERRRDLLVSKAVLDTLSINKTDNIFQPESPQSAISLDE
jgi:hypothetical protein